MYGTPRTDKSNPKNRYILASLTLVVLIFGGTYVYSMRVDNKKPTKQIVAVASSPIGLVATGDWIAHDSVNAQAKQTDGSYDYSAMVAAVKPYMQQSDIRFCNDPILNGGKTLGITGYPKFNSPTEFVTGMGKFGCNLVNTASNHSFDFNQANITASVDAWKRVPNMLAVAGQNSSAAEHDSVHYFTVKGVKMAFLAYTTYINSDSPVQNNYGVNVYTPDFASRQVATAKASGAKVIIASMRWGTEYSTTVTAEQKAYAQALADLGVQVVLGHGSHELQPVQEITGATGNKTLVWYSLGNFLNTQIPAETLFNGLAYMRVDPKSYQVSASGYLPVYMHYKWSAASAKAEDTNTRRDVKMYLLENVTQQMIDEQQLITSVAAQKQRISSTLNAYSLQIPLLTSLQVKQWLVAWAAANSKKLFQRWYLSWMYFGC